MRPRIQGGAAGEAAIVGEGFGEAHADAGADRGCEPDQEGVVGFLGSDGCGEDGRQGGDGAIHQAGETRLYDLQDEEAAVGFILGVARAGAELVAPQCFGFVLVHAFFLRQVVEQLADAGIGRTGGGLPVEVLGLQFHGGGLAADDVEGQRADQPYRLAIDEALHVLAADEGEVIAEAGLVQFDEAAAVARLLLPHAFEHIGSGGIVLAKSVGEIAINAFVFFFEGNSESENFAFGETVETAHRPILIQERAERVRGKRPRAC